MCNPARCHKTARQPRRGWIALRNVGMAVGNLLGSCLINSLILALVDLSNRTSAKILSPKLAAHPLSALASVFLAAIVALMVLVPNLPTIGQVHIGTLLLLLGYLGTVRMIFLDRLVSRTARIDKSLEHEADISGNTNSRRLPITV